MVYLYIISENYCIFIFGTNKGSNYLVIPSNGKDLLEAPLDDLGKFRS